MRRAAWWAVAAMAAGMALYGQHGSEGHETRSERAREVAGEPAKGEHGSLEAWKWANFLLLAGVLGWAARKHAGPFFASRSLEIRKAMVDAGEIRADAERRAAEVDRRLANLAADIETLRKEALAEEEAESERASRRMAAELAKIQAQTEQEIAAAGKQARLELKGYAAQLALALAERKIRARMTPQVQDALVESFVRQLEGPRSTATPV